MNKIIICALAVLVMLGCSATKKEGMNKIELNNIVKEYVEKTTEHEDVEIMKKILRDNISDWVSEYSNMGFYEEEDYTISDMMIFGKDKDKVLLIVYALLKDSDDAEAKLLTGKLNKKDNWEFRFTGMPSFYYEYSEELRKGNKFTEEEVMTLTIANLVEDGLVTFYHEVSQDYIKNKWF